MQALLERNEQQLDIRDRIEKLETELRAAVREGSITQTIADCKVDNTQAEHYFGAGVYARALWIPAGTVVVGKLHKHDRICIVAQGRCKFLSEFEEGEVTGPWIGEFKGGSKTAVFAFEDTYWIACTRAISRDPDEVLDDLVVDTPDEYTLYIESGGS